MSRFGGVTRAGLAAAILVFLSSRGADAQDPNGVAWLFSADASLGERHSYAALERQRAAMALPGDVSADLKRTLPPMFSALGLRSTADEIGELLEEAMEPPSTAESAPEPVEAGPERVNAAPEAVEAPLVLTRPTVLPSPPLPRPSADIRRPARLAMGRGCHCPYDTKSDGSFCGADSEWNRPGGWAPICYEGEGMWRPVR